MKKLFSFYLEEEQYSKLLDKLEQTNSGREVFETISNLIISDELMVSNNQVVNIDLKDKPVTQEITIVKTPVLEILDTSTLISKSIAVPSDWIINRNLMLVRSLLELSDSLYPSNLKTAKQAFKAEVDGKENMKKEQLLDALSHDILCSIQIM